MTWTNNLKVAIIEEDMDSISKALNGLPNFEDLDEAKEALSLIQTAINLAKEKKKETLETMNKIKKTKEFLNY